ncbi:anti sigma factor C-terminal domain-containing protein [Solibacillus sp. CAU 1738]|uniref:anti sigma factor C-terminal domain-containing protein n=1 Tax=Solibacillus sp. CAU 1738 TaxID=3140363 RepID=UPI003261ADCE
MREWSKDTENKILKKSKFTLTWRILQILFVMWLLYGLYSVTINMLADKLNITKENAYYTKIAVEWQTPNIRASFDLQEKDLSLLGTKEFSFPLQKMVGGDDILIGEANVTKKLSTNDSHIVYSHPGRDRLSSFSFSLPEHPVTHEKLKGNTNLNVWPTLEKLPEGTVGELAFSTTNFMTAEELVTRLKEFDIHIVWLPLYTGELVDYMPGGTSSGDNSMSVIGYIGLTGGSNYNEDFHESLRIRYITEDNLEESQMLMEKNMKNVLAKPESYYKNFLRLVYLKEQYTYITSKGFTTYGAVVTGPVKELLKLKELEWIQGEQLGEVALWNWEL